MKDLIPQLCWGNSVRGNTEDINKKPQCLRQRPYIRVYIKLSVELVVADFFFVESR